MTSRESRPGDAPGSSGALWFVQTFVVLILIWIALNGFSGLWAGIIAALGGAAVGAHFARGQPYPWRPLKWLAFAGFFVLESFKGGTDVAWRAVHPTPKIDPCFQTHRIAIPSGLPVTLLTAFISLLPGTLSVRLISDDRELIVHALTPAGGESVKRLERMLRWIFGAAPESPH